MGVSAACRLAAAMLTTVTSIRLEALRMFNRVALLVASLAASLVLAVGLALAGFVPASPAPSAATAATAAATDPATAAPPAPITQIDTVYVAPQATPQQITIQKVVTTHHSGDDGNESGGD